MNSPIASSLQYVQNHLKTPGEGIWNGQPLFIAQDEEEPTSAPRSPMKLENAEVRFDNGRMNAENIDPHLEAVALSGQSVTGLSRVRPGKRKSRVSNKVPIRVFSADAENFMAMVHKLTGLQSSPQNPLMKPHPYRALHPVMQGMLAPEFSGFSTSNIATSDRFIDKSPNTWSHSDFDSNQTAQLASFHDSIPLSNKSSSMLGGHAIMANVPSIWQPLEDYGRKDECFTVGSNMNKFPHESVRNAGQQNRKQDQDPRREALDW
ncbi:hypothetical protein L7F22_045645 [Adiantum nelumboides]|nr:hypothetical protein [Adiantum nelumboides]